MASLKRLLKNWNNQRNRRTILRRFSMASIGSSDWLAGAEEKFGGMRYVNRRAISPSDSRTRDEVDNTPSVGGDRMSEFNHGYGEYYQSHLQPYVEQRQERFTICEIGILQGTGLAIWCDLFPNSRVIGLDFELGYFNDNFETLKKLGAFSQNSPEIYHFDQFDSKNTEYLHEILNGDKVDICVDDGCHANEAVLTALKSFSPHLNNDFVYFVEDNKNVHVKIRNLYDQFNIQKYDISEGLTVISNRKRGFRVL